MKIYRKEEKEKFFSFWCTAFDLKTCTCLSRAKRGIRNRLPFSGFHSRHEKNRAFVAYSLLIPCVDEEEDREDTLNKNVKKNPRFLHLLTV
jgi:hypothetical protein